MRAPTDNMDDMPDSIRVGRRNIPNPLGMRVLKEHSFHGPTAFPGETALIEKLHSQGNLPDFARIYDKIVDNRKAGRKQGGYDASSLLRSVAEVDSFVCCANGSTDDRMVANGLRSGQLPYIHTKTEEAGANTMTREKLAEWLDRLANLKDQVASLYALLGGIGHLQEQRKHLTEADKDFIRAQLDKTSHFVEGFVREDLNFLPPGVIEKIKLYLRIFQETDSSFNGLLQAENNQKKLMREIAKMSAALAGMDAKVSFAILGLGTDGCSEIDCIIELGLIGEAERTRITETLRGD